MIQLNLSEWALRNRSLVLYAMLLLGGIGFWCYAHLGQSEDPPFTFKAMFIQTLWPGASAEEVAEQINERIETKLQETGAYEFIRSYARPGESNIFFIVKDAKTSKEIPELWYQIRKKVTDIRHTLPAGAIGPFFNDEFGETYGNIYALVGDGFDYAQLKDYAKRLQLALLRVPDVAKVDLLGLQDEKIFIEISNAKIATLGIPFSEILAALETQNAVEASGAFETASDRIYLRVAGAFGSPQAIANMPIRAGGRSLTLADIGSVRRGFADPPREKMRFMGQEAVGVAVSMVAGGNVIRLGENLDAKIDELTATLPVGMSLHHVANQPLAVKRSIREFVRSLAEAIVIVLAVSFFSLGFRTGLVVALSIPLVLAMTFAAMKYFNIDLHKISLGALILALGLLVDDAIIAVEMMAIKLEQGFDRIRAAAFAYSTTAFPMLTGTLITAAGFLPIATAQSSTGEYTRSIFQVVTISLLLSWVAAVVFIPYLGYRLLPAPHRSQDGGLAQRDPYRTPFYARFRAFVMGCLRRKWTVIGLTALVFALSVVGFRWVPQQFFPDSTRLELMVDLKLPEGASIAATETAAKKLEAILKKDDDIERFVAYVGTGSPRFYLPLDQQLPQASFAQFVIATKSVEARERARTRLSAAMRTGFPELIGRVVRLENGPPVGYPVQFRVSGEDVATVQRIAQKVAAVMGSSEHLENVNLDWHEKSKAIRIEVDQDRARVAGVSSRDLARFLQESISGAQIGVYREQDELIAMVVRGPRAEREHLSLIRHLTIPSANGPVPLAQIARVAYGFEPGIIWRRNRLPTVTVRGDIRSDLQPPTVTAELLPRLQPIAAELPSGYLLETGGTVEDSARGQKSVAAGVPLFVFVVTTLLMFQLRSFSKALMVWLTAPLGLIGVTLFLLAFNRPFGFVAMLGTIALSGMIMRNSVILVDQIDRDIAEGASPAQAIVEATVRRLRPIVLTALAAVLAMIPLSRSVFFGPMAVAIMGGLVVATVLTVAFLPALYAAWFRVSPAR